MKETLISSAKSITSIMSMQTPYRNRPIRFFVLFLLSMVVFANMYAFNNPQALQGTIMKQLQISQTKFNMLYTIIALPNIIFPFFVGIIIDYLGIRIAFVSLTFGVVVFQTIVAFGGVSKSFQMMLIGRMFFGIAVESLSVAQTCFVSYWFLGKQLAFSIGLATTLPQLGNALNSLVTPIIFEKTNNLGAPLFVSVGICCISFGCACVAVYIDKKADQLDLEHHLCVVTDPDDVSETGQPERIKLKDLKQLPIVFWLVVCLCMFAIAQYIPFLDNVNKLIQVRFCFSQVSAGKNIMVTYLVTALVGFPLGILVDKIGYKRYLTMTGMAIFMISHIIIYVYPQCNGLGPETSWSGASWGLFLLGFSYCFYANCIIPSIPVVVSKRVTGSAFGIMLIFENFAMALCPMISGQIVENSTTEVLGYKNVSLFFLILGAVGLALSFLLFFINDNAKKVLDGTAKQKKVYAIQLTPISYSDGQIMEQRRNSQNSLIERLIKTYSHIDFPQEKQSTESNKFKQGIV